MSSDLISVMTEITSVAQVYTLVSMKTLNQLKVPQNVFILYKAGLKTTKVSAYLHGVMG